MANTTMTKKRKATAKKPAGTKITKETYLNWYEIMVRIRKFEERSQKAYMEQQIRGFLHLYIGQEAVAAGVVSGSRHSDPIITAYRDHGLALARGLSSKAGMAELFGKATGCSKGKGGSMHFFDKENNFFGGHGIVGGQIPLGAGLAFAEQYRGSDNVCYTFFGDGAARQGSLHETFNMAMLWKLPVVFICENNHYAMGTSVERTSNVTDIAKLGLAYDMPSEIVDGMTCESVHDAIYRAGEHARSGKGPILLEIKTYRYKGHSISDPAKYRTRDELSQYRKIDPIEVTKSTILKKKYATEEVLKKIDDKIKKEIEEAVEFADESPYPDPEEMYNDIYIEPDYPFIKE